MGDGPLPTGHSWKLALYSVILATRVRPLARASAQAARTAEARRLRDDQRLNSAGPAHAPSPRASPATAPGSRRGRCKHCSTGRFSLARRGGRIQCIGGSRSSIACCFPRSSSGALSRGYVGHALLCRFGLHPGLVKVRQTFVRRCQNWRVQKITVAIGRLSKTPM
jgi:hypothetical protein